MASPKSGCLWRPQATALGWLRLRIGMAKYTPAATRVLAGHLFSWWIPQRPGPIDVASSSDGTKLIAVMDGGFIYTSSVLGLNWVPRDFPAIWVCVASSSDGTKLAAAEQYGQIQTSSDSGVNWVTRNARGFYRGSDNQSMICAIGFSPGLCSKAVLV